MLLSTWYGRFYIKDHLYSEHHSPLGHKIIILPRISEGYVDTRRPLVAVECKMHPNWSTNEWWWTDWRCTLQTQKLWAMLLSKEVTKKLRDERCLAVHIIFIPRKRQASTSVYIPSLCLALKAVNKVGCIWEGFYITTTDSNLFEIFSKNNFTCLTRDLLGTAVKQHSLGLNNQPYSPTWSPESKPNTLFAWLATGTDKTTTTFWVDHARQTNCCQQLTCF